MQLFKNTASQKVRVFAFADAGHATLDAGEPVTGDAANISARTALDNAALGASNDVNPTEVDATNAPGFYEFDPTQAETNGDIIEWYPKSSTAGVQVVTVGGAVQMLMPSGFPDTVKQTGDSYARLGAPAGASVSADIADTLEQLRDRGDAAWITATGFSTLDAAGVRTAVGLAAANLDTQLSGIQTTANAVETNTQDLQSRTPAALIGGRMDVNVGSINSATVGVAGFERATSGIVRGTVDNGSTTTSINTNTMTPAAVVADQFVGLILKFDQDTTTSALRGQSTDIAASSSGGVLTVTALTTAPVSGDTFTIS